MSLYLEKSFGFEFKSRQRARRYQFDIRSKPDPLAQALLHSLRQRFKRTLIGVRLYDDPEFFHRFFFKDLYTKLLDLRKFSQSVFNGAGKHVDAADNHHIIHPPQHATLQNQKPASAGTRLIAVLHQIAGSITNHGTADPAKICDHQLTSLSFRYRFTGVGVQDLGNKFVLVDMNGSRLALEREGADFRSAGMIKAFCSPG